MSLNESKKHIVINLSNIGIFYNDREYIEWKNTNFPPKESFGFNERKKIYWEVEMIRFNKEQGELELDVHDYNVSLNKNTFSNQVPRYPLKSIKFKNIKWDELQKVMNHYTPINFEGLVNFEEQNEANASNELREKDYNRDLFDLDSEVNSSDEKREKIKISFQHPLMKTKFKMGFVEVEKKIKEIGETITIVLLNSYIIPEFDHVKPYFSKILGKKKIKIHGYLEFDENNRIVVDCHSNEINEIDESFIIGVKKLQLKKAVFTPNPISIDKSLFTPEEYFSGIEEEMLGNTSKKSDQDILKEILDLLEVRNKKQLIYLSGKLQSKHRRLRFTLSPKFGFLFSSEGEEMDHFLWELLDSHATYIWSIAKDSMSIEEKFKRLEREINFIRNNGRRAYLKNKEQSDFIFNKINHENSEKGIVDGFPKWKMKVNEKII